MPLPAALLARLKRRGIVNEAIEEEEVIAEHNEDDATLIKEKTLKKRDQQNKDFAPGCPNKWNPYHCCVEYCFDKWGDGIPEAKLSIDYNKRRLRMLKKYPLPVSWREVYDPGVARHYYWNTDTDEVSWLSPSHPRAIIGEAAPKLGKSYFEKIEYQKEVALAKAIQQEAKRNSFGGKIGKRKRSPSPVRRTVSESDDSETSDTEKRKTKNKDGEIELTNFDRLRRAKRKGIDPMDPAAYSDIPAGKWSSGLDDRGEAKTGVDFTATGPLFQARPYPAPGAILRRNAAITGEKIPD